MNLSEALVYSLILLFSSVACLALPLHYLLQRKHHTLSNLLLAVMCASLLTFLISSCVDYTADAVWLARVPHPDRAPSAVDCAVSGSFSFFSQQLLFDLGTALSVLSYRAAARLKTTRKSDLLRFLVPTALIALASTLYLGIGGHFVPTESSQRRSEGGDAQGSFTANCDLNLRTASSQIVTALFYCLPYALLLVALPTSAIRISAALSRRLGARSDGHPQAQAARARIRHVQLTLQIYPLAVLLCWFPRVLRVVWLQIAAAEGQNGPASVLPIDSAASEVLCNVLFLIGLIFYAAFYCLNRLRAILEAQPTLRFSNDQLFNEADYVYKNLLHPIATSQEGANTNQNSEGREPLDVEGDSFEVLHLTPAVSQGTRTASLAGRAQNMWAAWNSVSLRQPLSNSDIGDGGSVQFVESSMAPQYSSGV